MVWFGVRQKCLCNVLVSCTHTARISIPLVYSLTHFFIILIFQELVGCSSNLERVVKELAPFKIKLNKVVHFTMATIVVALQQTTVYPAVKVGHLSGGCVVRGAL